MSINEDSLYIEKENIERNYMTFDALEIGLQERVLYNKLKASIHPVD